MLQLTTHIAGNNKSVITFNNILITYSSYIINKKGNSAHIFLAEYLKKIYCYEIFYIYDLKYNIKLNSKLKNLDL